MDLSHPMRSVIPSSHGAVLTVLAHTTQPLSGRRVAELTDGQVSQTRTNAILSELSEAGIVLSESHPPAKLYRLNRDHVAAPGILALSEMWDALLERIKAEVASWAERPLTACLFGSAARGSAGAASDIDVLLVRTSAADSPADDAWQRQVDRLIDQVAAWSGNRCEVLELSPQELLDAASREDRLAKDLHMDAVTLFGPDVRTLLGPGAAS